MSLFCSFDLLFGGKRFTIELLIMVFFTRKYTLKVGLGDYEFLSFIQHIFTYEMAR